MEITAEIYKKCLSYLALGEILGIPVRAHKIPRSMSRTNPRLMYKWQAENRTLHKRRRNALKPYKVGSYSVWENDGYIKRSIYKYKDKYYEGPS